MRKGMWKETAKRLASIFLAGIILAATVVTPVSAVHTYYKDIPNVLYTPYISGKSVQSVERLSQKALANIRTFLSEVPQV